MTRKTEAAMLIPFNGGSRTQIAVLLTFYINASDLSFPNRVESFTSIFFFFLVARDLLIL